MSRTSTARALAVVAVVAVPATLPAQVSYTAYAPVITGQQAVGMDPGYAFNQANAPAVGAGAAGAYLMTVSGPGVTSATDDGIWANTGTSVYKLARNSDPVPGLSGVTWGDLNGKQPIANGSQVFFYAPLSGSVTTGVNDTSYWYGAPSNMQLLVRRGDAVAGLANVTYDLGNYTYRMNQSGEVAFLTDLTGSGTTGSTNQGIAVGTPGGLQVVVRKGDAAPGLGAATIGSFDTTVLSINNAGGVGYLTGLSNNGSASQAAWYKPAGGAPELVAIKTGVADGTGGLTFAAFHNYSPAINDSGFSAVRASLNGVSSPNDVGIWAGMPGNLKYVAREGDATPLAGVNYGVISNPLAVTAAGAVLFHSTLTGSVTTGTDAALFYGAPGSVKVLAREGDAAPGTGQVFGSFDQQVHAMSDGRVVFVSQLAAAPGGGSTGDSLWYGTPDDLHLILRHGDQIDVDPGPGVNLKTVNQIAMLPNTSSGGEDGYPRAVADDFTVGVELTFTDGTEAPVILTVTPTPEPGVCLLVGAAGLGGLGWYRRRRAAAGASAS